MGWARDEGPLIAGGGGGVRPPPPLVVTEDEAREALQKLEVA